MRESVLAAGEEARLRRTVERLLARSPHGRRTVTGLRREPSPFASRCAIDVLTLELDDGGRLSLLVKHVDDEQDEHPDKQCREREIRVYEALLGDEVLPVVAFHGWSRDSRARRRDVFLEYVPDWDLRYQELAHWYTAARRLAEMHAYFAERAEALARCDFLLRLDAEYLRGWAERAVRVARGYDEGLGDALLAVSGECGRAAALLERQPPTLVHNDLAPKNVVVDRASRPARVAFIDWELAGIGCGVLDLVDLKYGLAADADERMRLAYGEALEGTPLFARDPERLTRLLAAAELHRTIYRLAHSATWGLPAETVRRWVGEVRQLARRL